MSEIFEDACFHLNKWLSNSPELESDQAPATETDNAALGITACGCILRGGHAYLSENPTVPDVPRGIYALRVFAAILGRGLHTKLSKGITLWRSQPDNLVMLCLYFGVH